MSERKGHDMLPLQMNSEATLPANAWERACDLYRRTLPGSMHRGRANDSYRWFCAGVSMAKGWQTDHFCHYVKEAVDSGRAVDIPYDLIEATVP